MNQFGLYSSGHVGKKKNSEGLSAKKFEWNCTRCCTILTLTASSKYEPSVCVQRWIRRSIAEAARCCQSESFALRLWYERTAASSSAASVCESTAASNPVSSACTDYNHTKQWHTLSSREHSTANLAICITGFYKSAETGISVWLSHLLKVK